MNKKILIFLLIINLLFLTGCSMLEIEDYSIVAGIGIDYENDDFIVTYEIYEENNGQTTNLTSITKTEIGKTISIATNKIATQMNKKPYLNHTSVIIINEKIVKEKFNETINYLLHDVRIRSACIVMISKEQTSREIFEQSQKQNKVIAYEIYKHFDIKKGIIEKWSNSKFNEIINEKLNKNGTIIIPTVTYKEDFDINGVYLIKSDNSNLYVNKKEVFVFQMFNNYITEGLFNVEEMESYYIKKIDSKLTYNKEINEILLTINLKILSYEELNKENEEEYITKVKMQLSDYIINIYNYYINKGYDPFRIYKFLYQYHQLMFLLQNELLFL